jgi:hypothetical protein
MPVITTLNLRTAQSGTWLWTCGHVFKKGSLPAGQTLLGLQTNIRTTWPDGSAQITSISGSNTFTANTPLVINIETGSAASGSNVTTATLVSQSITATVDAGSFGAASWSGTDWNTPFKTWISGPICSTFIYRKQIGTDPHLVAWLEVRIFSNNMVEVLPWIENCYVYVAGSTNKNSTYSFTLNGTSRFTQTFDLPNHCRTPLIFGSELRYVASGTNPDIIVAHNGPYFSSTKLVPKYRVTLPDNALAINNLPTTYAPLQQGNYPTGMGGGGYHGSIAIIPEWDVTYLLNSTSPKPWKAVQINAYSAGRYGIHWRDENTNEPVKFSTYPNGNVGYGSGIGDSGNNGVGGFFVQPTGTVPPTFKPSHHPSIGFVAYLITGSFYHLESVQFNGYLQGFKAPAATRQFGKMILWTDDEQTRGASWGLRSYVQAAVASPDGSSHKTEFINALSENVTAYHTRYIVNPGNPMGFTREYGGGSYNGSNPPAAQATWMHDFFAAVLGYWRLLEVPLSTGVPTKFEQFYTWKVQTIANRFGGAGATEYLYRDAGGAYAIAVAPDNTPYGPNLPSPGLNGPWYSNWGEVWQNSHDGTLQGASSGLQIPRVKEIGDTSLRGGYFPEGTSYWGNMLPALTYLVSNGYAGAQASYDLVTSASNWNQLEASFANYPVYATAPHDLDTVPPPIQGQTTRVDNAPLVTNTLVMGNTGMGVLGSQIPNSGTDGPAIPWDKLNLPYDNTVEIRTEVTSVSPGLIVDMNELGAVEFTVTGDGVYTFTTNTWKAGQLYLAGEVHTINIGNPINLVAAPSTTTSSSSTSTVGQSHNILGSGSSGTGTSSTGALSSTITLAGSTCSSSTLSSSVGILQIHNISGGPSSTSTMSSTGAINFINVLIGSDSATYTFSQSGQVIQAHNILGLNCITNAQSRAIPLYGAYGKIKSIFISVGELGLRPFT